MPHRELLDFNDYPHITAAGIGDFYLLPDGRARLVWFDWYRFEGIFRRKIVGTLTREAATLRTGAMDLMARLEAAHH